MECRSSQGVRRQEDDGIETRDIYALGEALCVRQDAAAGCLVSLAQPLELAGTVERVHAAVNMANLDGLKVLVLAEVLFDDRVEQSCGVTATAKSRYAPPPASTACHPR